MSPKIIPRRKVLRTWEEMSQALDKARDGDVMLVNICFHRNLLLQAAWRRDLEINVVVDTGA